MISFERYAKHEGHSTFQTFSWPRSTMDSIRVSEAPDSGSIPDEATTFYFYKLFLLNSKKLLNSVLLFKT